MDAPTYDVDWIVVGSGFGGSVAALRLAQKGYRVQVLEAGRRFRDEDFAVNGWDTRNTFWAPRIGLTGPSRISVFKDIFIASGAGVGGQAFARMKIGVGRPPVTVDGRGATVEQYVLASIPEEEWRQFRPRLSLAEEAEALFLRQGIEAGMNGINGR